MSQDEGGGASRTTEAAAGSSAPTDVSLREFVSVRLEALDRHLTSELASLQRETVAAHNAAERAVNVAADEAKERLLAHNGLIEQMQQQAAHFATRESLDDFKEATGQRLGRIEKFQATIVGMGFILSFIGAANLIKVWTG